MITLAHIVLAVAWLLGLWVAARLLDGGPRAADRLRDMLALGTAIPLVLGFLHLLRWPFLWLALIGCVVGAYVRATRRPKHRSHLRAEPHFAEPVPYLLLAALALVACAPFVRAHVVAWGAPQLFASALSEVAVPGAAAWSGLGALALLGLRLYTWAREGASLPTRLADAFAAATVCIFPLALFGRPLQSDVWLAAFFVEILWSAPVDDRTVLRSAATCALVTPFGWLYAAVGLAASHARARAWIAVGTAIVIWALHDAILWHGAFAPHWAVAIVHAFRTHAFTHAAAALRFGFTGAVRFAPLGLLFVLAALASPVLSREAPLRFAAIGAAAVALFVQSAFDPAMAAGALVLAPLTLRYARLTLILLVVAFGGEALRILLSYHAAALVLLALVAAIVTPAAVGYVRRFMKQRVSLQPS